MTIFLLVSSLILHYARCTNSSPSVIIVGAGPSGIAAATRLLENSITNIEIIEGENRIGGRINSVNIGGSFVDLGAEFCHGQDGNIVYTLAKDILQDFQRDFTKSVYYSNSSRLNAKFTEEYLDTIFDVDQFADNCFRSVGECYIKGYNSTFFAKYADDAETLKVAQNALPRSEYLTVTNEGSFSWLKPVMNSHWTDCPGKTNLTWSRKHGYKTILDIMMKKYPDPANALPIADKIRLNTTVKEIVWSSPDGVSVVTDDGAVRHADHVIFTPSVGVLKHKHRTLFKPNLPAYKQEAINKIGFDGVMKIILHFSTQWWDADNPTMIFIWRPQDMCEDADCQWVDAIAAMAGVDEPNVLIAWISGAKVPEIENYDDARIKRGIMFVLNKFMGRLYNVSEPDAMLKSTWCSNEHFLGTYSYEDIDYFNKSVSYHEQLSRPLSDSKGRVALQFAGEATNPTHFATVHGAIETGHREADRLIEMYKK